VKRSTPLIGADALAAKGWLGAHRWLLLRRLVQICILLLFLAGPWFGLKVAGQWIVKGNLSSSLALGVLPLTDPYLLLQSLAARHWPTESKAWIGAAIVLVFYGLIGGRVFCSWVCPVNMVTDAAAWLRQRLGIKGGGRLSRSTRYWVLAMTLIVAFITGSIAWELVNPVSMMHRGIIFGMDLVGAPKSIIGALRAILFGTSAILAVIAALFLFDLFVVPRGWCGHLCPVGAFYSLIGRFSLLRIGAVRRDACNDCADCYAVCPEPLIIKPALKGVDGAGPVIASANCTNCGRCIDVCSKDVFEFGGRRRTVIPVTALTTPPIQAGAGGPAA
jgi:ferredoxin-type protein NapH